jgi:FAD/FMN-containing dehydrogenase
MPTRSSVAVKAAKTTRKASAKDGAATIAINKKAVKKTAVKKAPPKKTKAKVATKKTAKKAAPKKAVKKTTTKKKAPKKVTKKTSKKATKVKAATTKAMTTSGKSHPLGHLLIARLFREAGFRGGISSQDSLLDAYSTDESIFSIRPQVVLQPKNRRDVELAAKVVAQNVEQFPSLSLTPRAAGTGLGGGSLTDSIVIDMCAHMQKIGEVTQKKNETTIVTEPGAMWRDLEKKLKKHNAYIPSFPASKDICSIGGAIGNNAAGPDSLRYGHCASWVSSMEVVLHDGHTYTIKPLSFREYKLLIKQDHEHARIAREIFELISKNEKEIKKGKPHTAKNSAGYPLWSVLPEGVAKFKKGTGTFDLTQLIAGSQGTIGIITSLVIKAIPIPQNTALIAIPIFNLDDSASTIVKALKHKPINVEVFDSLSFDLALKNPSFFKDRMSATMYYRTMLSMYTTYHVRFRRKLPEFMVLVTLDEETVQDVGERKLVESIASENVKPRLVKNPIEREMLWQIRRASYTLSKFQDAGKRPAAFLEDMTVPPENLSKFFKEIKKLLKEFGVTAAVHGHGGNGHFHFYPLLDFTNKKTPDLVEKMAEKFFATAVKFDGNICGEHNDGIIRTPHLSKMFSKKMLDLFVQAEHIFDPYDVFNPGKKVNPRFDIKETMRTTN